MQEEYTISNQLFWKAATILIDYLRKHNHKCGNGSYYVEGKEQDIIFLWKNYAFVFEAKGYALREPLRNSEKAFVRIKDDFNGSIG
jgi:hypothetical protein